MTLITFPTTNISPPPHLAFRKPWPPSCFLSSSSSSREIAGWVLRQQQMPFIVRRRSKVPGLRAEPPLRDYSHINDLKGQNLDEREEEEEEEEELAKELEGLEEEEMGGAADKRRELSDYDRRAHIFDESSRVFQALKEKHQHATHIQQTNNDG